MGWVLFLDKATIRVRGNYQKDTKNFLQMYLSGLGHGEARHVPFFSFDNFPTFFHNGILILVRSILVMMEQSELFYIGCEREF